MPVEDYKERKVVEDMVVGWRRVGEGGEEQMPRGRMSKPRGMAI
jgi:hypothetical protein